jgi:ABC-type glycerol-3-phosphate transport system substrate-binding protein
MQISRCFKFVVISLLIFSFIGCGRKSQKTADDTIVIWHWMTDRKEAFNALADKYQQETGKKVKFKLFFPPGIYSQKVIAAARADNLPDIFGILGEKKVFASFIKAGHVANLTTQMKANNSAWEDRFFDYTFTQAKFRANNDYDIEPGIYAVPLDTSVMQFVYNKDLLADIGINADNVNLNDFNSFIEIAKKIEQQTEADGFICGWGEGWLLHSLAVEWAINIMGEDDFIKTIKGEKQYTDKEWLEVFSLFVELKESGILASNIGTMTNKQAEDAFAKGKAAFAFDGSWAVNVYGQLNPDLNYGFFSLPKVKKNNPIKVWGGAGASFMVSAKSPHKDEAIAFLDWLTKKPQQKFLIEKTNNLPAIKGCQDQLPPILADLSDNLEQLTHPDLWPVNEQARVTEIIDRNLQQIIMGIKTPKAAAREIQQIKNRVAR